MTALERENRFDEIYLQYSRLVWWHIWNKVAADPADKEDIVQNIWMGIWKSVDKIQPGKEHAYVESVIRNQINKFIYYRTRDNKLTSVEKENSSEGEDYSLLEITEILDQSDEYTYLELLDVIDKALDEEEFNLFIEYYQGVSLREIATNHHKGFKKMEEVFDVIKDKLSKAFEQEAKLPFLYKRRKHKRGKYKKNK